MKIAMIGHKTVPSRAGGIEVAVGELSVRMKERGHEPELYNRWEIEWPKGPVEYQGIRMYNVPTFKHSALNAFVYSAAATVCAVCRGYDVIHIHAEGPAAMTWLPKLLGIPVVVTIHGMDWKRDKWGRFASFYLKLGERIAAGLADEVIVLSESARQYFKETYGRECSFIRNGVSIGDRRDPDKIREKWGLEPDGYILFLSRLMPEKGLHYLIQAYSKLNTEKRLVIAGKIGHTPYVHKISEMAQRDPRILMTDFVEGEILEELFHNCSLYVLPSTVEGMAISLLEALSCGTRCLVSDIPENKNIADPHIRYFIKGDTEDLKKQLESCLAEKMSEEERESQTAYMRENYGWDSVTDQTLALYKRVVAKKRGGRRRC